MAKHFFQVQVFIFASVFLWACSTNELASKAPKTAKENKKSLEKNTSNKKSISKTKKDTKVKSETLKPEKEETYKDLATPSEPFISPGDVIRIEVLEEANLTREVVVPANGRVFYPLLKQIEVKGRTTKELSEELTQKLSEYLVSPMVNVFIARRAHNKVYIYAGAGASQAFVLKQGETMTASRLLISAGIPLDADLNEVYLVRKNRSGKKQTIRLPIKNVLENYELEKDAVLQPEDLLIIKKSDKVYIQGHVVKPGAYPIPKGEKLNLWALIIKANGPLNKADLDNVKIIRQKSNNEREIFLVSASPTKQSSSVMLQSNDIIIVPSQARNSVTIYGEIRKAGAVPLSGDDVRISTVMAMAGGVTEFASDDIKLYRYMPNGKTKKFSLSFSDITKGDSSQDIILKPGDIIYIDARLW